MQVLYVSMTGTAVVFLLCGHADDASHRVCIRRSDRLSGHTCHRSSSRMHGHRQVQRDRPRSRPVHCSCWLSWMPGNMPAHSSSHTPIEQQGSSCQSAQKDELSGPGKYQSSAHGVSSHVARDHARHAFFNAFSSSLLCFDHTYYMHTC